MTLGGNKSSGEPGVVLQPLEAGEIDDGGRGHLLVRLPPDRQAPHRIHVTWLGGGGGEERDYYLPRGIKINYGISLCILSPLHTVVKYVGESVTFHYLS